ncbi:MAG: aminotransferase class IV [Candidatus Pacebacteria bacterium]|nr:aminotransferase class IV [Candidatus Paceibacterota bacterium]
MASRSAKKYCYLNGRILPEKDAKVSINDIGIIRGFGIFDVMRAYNGKPFLFDMHIRRFINSAKLLGLKFSVPPKKVKEIIITLLKKNNMPNDQVRLILTGGEAIEGIFFNKKQPTFYIIIEKFTSFPKPLYEKGGKLMVEEFQRIFPEAKTLNYITAVSLQQKRLKEKAVEILYTLRGKVFEASTSNIFIVKKGRLITPEKNILIGTTRNFVISLAKGKYAVTRRDVTLKDLYTADEVFITATNKEIVPIVNVGGKIAGGGKPGQVTLELMKKFRDKVGKHSAIPAL